MLFDVGIKGLYGESKCHLPIYPFEYPFFFKISDQVTASSCNSTPKGADAEFTLLYTLFLIGHCPVINIALAGEHTG